MRCGVKHGFRQVACTWKLGNPRTGMIRGLMMKRTPHPHPHLQAAQVGIDVVGIIEGEVSMCIGVLGAFSS